MIEQGLDSSKRYIPPDYSLSPVEDDDDDEYVYDGDLDLTGEEQSMENYLDRTMNQSYHSSSPWSNYQPQTFSPWSQSPTPSTSKPGVPKKSVADHTHLQASSVWSQENNIPGRIKEPWHDISVDGKIRLPRDRDTAIIDMIDGAVESLQSKGRKGMMPRGLYDVRLRFDLWDFLMNSGAKYIVLSCPNTMEPRRWMPLYEYVISCMADYMSVPRENFVLAVPRYYGQEKNDLLIDQLKNDWHIIKNRAILIGQKGGGAYESDDDMRLSKILGIPFYQINNFTNNYY